MNFYTRKNILFCLLTLLFTCTFFAQRKNVEENVNYFLSDSFKENDVTIDYSVVTSISKKQINKYQKKVFQIELLEFLIENAHYNNEIYKDNDLTGVSFPINTAVNLLVDLQILYGNKILVKQALLSSGQKNTVEIYAHQDYALDEIKFEIIKTKEIKKQVATEILTSEIKDIILKQNKTLTENEKEEEYTRLMILGNEYLNRNNYNQAVAAYIKAKKYSTKQNPDSQIETTIKYAANNNTKIDLIDYDTYSSKVEKPVQIVSNNHGSIKEVSSTIKEVSKNENTIEPVKTEIVNGQEYEYEYEYEVEYEVEHNNNYNEIVIAANEDDIEYEYEYEYETVAKPIQQDVVIFFNDSETEYEYEDENGNIITEIEPIEEKVTQADITPIKLSSKKQSKKTEKSKTLLVSKKGFIKYKRDEQAVVDSDGEILIPYGKYAILRYRSGFARVKIKDEVELKNIVCTNKNEEYVWSARIYENPWVETVIDKNGNYVDELYKKVEIYVVDNVNYRPKEELSKELLDNYKDPNPFNGLTQVSAFNLWNRENSNNPDVIEKRKEIERLKDISKNEAFKGATECRKQVSPKLESVVNYYKNLGYQVFLKH